MGSCSLSLQSHCAGAIVALINIFRSVILNEILSLHFDVTCSLCLSNSQVFPLALSLSPGSLLGDLTPSSLNLYTLNNLTTLNYLKKKAL